MDHDLAQQEKPTKVSKSYSFKMGQVNKKEKLQKDQHRDKLISRKQGWVIANLAQSSKGNKKQQFIPSPETHNPNHDPNKLIEVKIVNAHVNMALNHPTRSLE